MVEALSRLPPEVTPSKEVVAQHLRPLGRMSETRRRERRLDQRHAPSRARAPRQVRSRRQGPALGSAVEDRSREKLRKSASGSGRTPDRRSLSSRAPHWSGLAGERRTQRVVESLRAVRPWASSRVQATTVRSSSSVIPSFAAKLSGLRWPAVKNRRRRSNGWVLPGMELDAVA